MRRTHVRFLTCAGLALAAPAAARGAVTANWVVVPITPAAAAQDPALNNMQSWSLRATTDGDWGAGGFEATLPAGMNFYNSSFGSNTKPNPHIVAVFPSTAYDTYVTSPSDTGAPDGSPPWILGGFPPGSAQSLGGNRVSVIWGDAVTDAPGTYEILRLTFPNSAVPNVNQLSFTTQSNPTAAAPAGINLGPPNQMYAPNSWRNDADGDWNVAGNWTGNELPTLRRRILVDVGGANVRTITHASGDTVLHELRNFERIVLSGGTLSSYVTEVNGELLVAGGTFKPLGFHHLTGTGNVVLAPSGRIASDLGLLAIGPSVTLSASGAGGVVSALVINRGGRMLAPDAADVLTLNPIHLRLEAGEVGGAGAVRATGAVVVAGTAAKTGAGPLRVNGSLSISGSNSALNLAGGSVLIDYTGASPLADVRGAIVTGYDNNTWTGPGINSTTAAANDHLAVGYAEAAALFTTFPATFAGESIDATTLLVRLTRNGDANLDGTVNLDDFNRLAANFGSTNALWDDGDFNYDGVVNLPDFNLLAANFGQSASGSVVTPADWATLASAVPEPGAASVVFTLVFASRRRRRG